MTFSKQKNKLLQNLLTVSVNNVLLSSDEAQFHLNGSVRKYNFRYWAENYIHQLHERPLYSSHVTIWNAVGNVVFMVLTFQRKKAQMDTVNCPQYKMSANNTHHTWKSECVVSTGWTDHIAHGCFEELFPGRFHLVIWRHPVACVITQSHPLQFFLCGHLKANKHQQ